MRNRYVVSVYHGESRSIFHVVDTDQPQDEQPAVIHSFETRYLADDFCQRHNAREHPTERHYI